jgi:hypothetical protein
MAKYRIYVKGNKEQTSAELAARGIACKSTYNKGDIAYATFADVDTSADRLICWYGEDTDSERPCKPGSLLFYSRYREDTKPLMGNK